MQRFIIWHKDALQSDCTEEMIPNALEEPHSLIWVDLQLDGPTDHHLTELAKTFQISSLTLDSITDTRERSRLVAENEYFYLLVHGIVLNNPMNNQDPEAETPKLDIIFGKNYLLTIHNKPLPWLDELYKSATQKNHHHQTRDDIPGEHLLSRGMARLLYAVLDSLVDSYFPVLDQLDDIIDNLEMIVVNNSDKKIQTRLFRIKQVVGRLRRAISPQVEVLNALVMRTGEFIPTEAEAYFSDVHGHMLRTFEMLDSYRDLLSGLLDVHLSTISNRMNEVMKQLTIISTIFLPITFITGIFGQNFGHSPQVDNDSGWNFWIVLILMAVVTVSQLIFFRIRKWI